jgi:hypothetical protein
MYKIRKMEMMKYEPKCRFLYNMALADHFKCECLNKILASHLNVHAGTNNQQRHPSSIVSCVSVAKETYLSAVT